MKQRIETPIRVSRPIGMNKKHFKKHKQKIVENLKKDFEEKKRLKLQSIERSYLRVIEWIDLCEKNNFVRGTIYHKIGNHYYYNSDRVGMEKTFELH